MYGRAESAPLSKLKQDSSVSVNVLYDYSGARYNGAGGNSGNILMSFGYDSYINTSKGIAAGTGLANPLINNEIINIDATGDTKHYGNTSHTKNVQIPTCNYDTRLCWRVNNDRASTLGANGSYWLYIDNVRVSIAQ